ncbi:hypothetical protein OBBRIDRAFT_232433 [Obba rivulosa]|uniref:Uncharacterized protein n=1 Tax=Obba rivulosa TaxID=1052685 RepID=A0A8E2DVI5_9APHY|nr:hypothetical protein OBBRIDRAFT_232433 [Obba rivulosa]
MPSWPLHSHAPEIRGNQTFIHCWKDAAKARRDGDMDALTAARTCVICTSKCQPGIECEACCSSPLTANWPLKENPSAPCAPQRVHTSFDEAIRRIMAAERSWVLIDIAKAEMYCVARPCSQFRIPQPSSVTTRRLCEHSERLVIRVSRNARAAQAPL